MFEIKLIVLGRSDQANIVLFFNILYFVRYQRILEFSKWHCTFFIILVDAAEQSSQKVSIYLYTKEPLVYLFINLKLLINN